MSPITELHLTSPTSIEIGGKTYACTIGRGGFAAPGEKREGDMKTPTGRFPLRCLYYRPDRVEKPVTGLEAIALTPSDGWCDDPADPMYNQFVKLPYAGRHEKLWREDHVYDLIIPLGYNDGPIVPDLGSAIFLHLKRPDGVGTEGCLALSFENLSAILPRIDSQTVLIVNPDVQHRVLPVS